MLRRQPARCRRQREPNLGYGAELAVVFRNLDEDSGIDFLVLPPDGGDAIEIAALDGHQTGPGFSWTELAAVA
jgi:hypothetical protein